MSVIGLDLGTTACKAIALNADGKVVAHSMQEYNVAENEKGFVELNPQDVWESVRSVLRGVAGQTKNDPIQAISISAMGDTVTPFDESLRPLSNSILAFDTRSQAEAEILGKQLGDEWLFNTTGMPLHAMYTACKILWLKRNSPEVFSKTKKFLCYEDYIVAKLGAVPSISFSNAARTMIFDLKQNKWNDRILDVLGIDESNLATPVPSGTVVGNVDKNIACELGMTESVKIVSGSHDQTCGALGAGIVSEGNMLVSTGTLEILFFPFNKLTLDASLLGANMCCYPHAYPGRYCSIGMIFTAGAAFRWFRDEFGYEDLIEAKANNEDVYDVITSKFTEEPSEIYFIPHLSGSGTPDMNPLATGCIYGLTLGTDKYDIAQAILEGISYELKINVDLMSSMGIPVNSLKCIGGGAKSKYWLQLKANMTGLKTTACDFTDVGAIGASILAGYGIGLFKTLEEGINLVQQPVTEYYPNPSVSTLYQSRFHKYLALREKVNELHSTMKS